MSLRKIVDEQDARGCLAAVAGSGLGRAAWARANGVLPRSLNAWRVTLDRRARRLVPGAVRMVELVPGPPAGGEPVVLRVGRVEIDVGAGVDDATLARVLRVVLAC